MGGGIVGLLLIWQLVPALLGGAGPAAPPNSSGTSSTGPIVAGEAPPAPEGSRSSVFPTSVEGTRLEAAVLGLGDHPPRCRAELLLVGADERAIFHHRCVDEQEGVDRYFFLVELGNLTDARVSVELDRFAVRATDGARAALTTVPAWVRSTKLFPPSATIVPGGSLKGWITVDGTDGFLPRSLSYADGAETLTVAFDGRWV